MTHYKATRERFSSRVDRRGDDECWPWTGGHDADGRGRFWLDGRNVPAPRVALILAGEEYREGQMACHHCDNPPCVNPSHLYFGDALSNVRDMLTRSRGRTRVPHAAARGERNHNAKLSDADVADIRRAYSGARGEQSALARVYGVTPQLIQLIVKGGHRV